MDIDREVKMWIMVGGGNHMREIEIVIVPYDPKLDLPVEEKLKRAYKIVGASQRLYDAIYSKWFGLGKFVFRKALKRYFDEFIANS